MKQVLFMAVLVAGMLMTGCSKDSESMEDKQVTDIKQHIVGSWEHDGDFFCKDISELSGNINGNIISGCTSEFISRNPATLVFGSDGRFELNRNVSDVDPEKEYKGTYTISAEKPFIWLNYDGGGSSLFREISEFLYYDVFFETDYNTIYLVSRGDVTIIICSRYRRK